MVASDGSLSGAVLTTVIKDVRHEFKRLIELADKRLEKEKNDAINRQDEDSFWVSDTYSKAQSILKEIL